MPKKEDNYNDVIIKLYNYAVTYDFGIKPYIFKII